MKNKNTNKESEKKNLIRVYKYMRVSTKRQVEKGCSLQDQNDVLDRFLSEHEEMVCVGTFVDGGVSGRKNDRNDYNAMMKGVKNHECDLIIFTRLDRWYRNLRHYLNTNATLEKNNVEWIAVEQQYYETRTPAGRAFVANSMSFAQFLAENNAETIIEHNKAKIARGEVVSGQHPIGYKVENKHLVFSETHYILVDVLKEWDRTNNISHCVKYLLEVHGISMTQANFKRSILQNEKIAGRCRDNENFCPATITWEKFQENQRLLGMNVKKGKKHEYIFNSLVVCDECDHVMSGCQQRTKHGDKKYFYNAYRCRQGINLKRCPNRKIMLESVLERYILANIKPELEKYIAEFEVSMKPVKDNRQKRIAIENKLERLKLLYLNEMIEMSEYRTDRAALLDELESLKDDDEEIKDLSSLKAFLESDFESVYKTLEPDEKRILWRSVIKQIRIDQNKNITIIFL